jgi:hypothetical protein
MIYLTQKLKIDMEKRTPKLEIRISRLWCFGNSLCYHLKINRLIMMASIFFLILNVNQNHEEGVLFLKSDMIFQPKSDITRWLLF